MSNGRVVREVLRAPVREAGLGPLRRRWLTFSPAITTYSVRNHPELMAENFDGSVIFHLAELGAFELEMEPTALWAEGDLATGAARVRELLAWRSDPAAPFPEGWRKPKIFVRNLN